MLQEIVVAALAVEMITHLVVNGEIFSSLRAILEAKYTGLIVKLVNCFECLSVWVSILASLLMWTINPLVIFAVAGLANFVHMIRIQLNVKSTEEQ